MGPHESLEKARQEIRAICKKYDVSLNPLYDEGVAVEVVKYVETDTGVEIHTLEID